MEVNNGQKTDLAKYWDTYLSCFSFYNWYLMLINVFSEVTVVFMCDLWTSNQLWSPNQCLCCRKVFQPFSDIEHIVNSTPPLLLSHTVHDSTQHVFSPEMAYSPFGDATVTADAFPMLSTGPRPTWLLKLRTCQPITLASC